MGCEIHLNRMSINSIEVPAQVQAEAGKGLVLTFRNHGHPLHISLSAQNPARFTPFVHENLFVQGETPYEIPIFEDAEEGVFSLEVVSGYGMKKGVMKVLVRKPLPVRPAKEPGQEQAGIRIPWETAIPLAAGLALYALSFAAGLALLKDLAFLALLAALLYPWFRKG